GHVDLMNPAMAVQKELVSIPDFGATEEDGLFIKEKKALLNLKKAGLMVAGAAVQKYMQKLSDEQEVLMNLADMLIEVYVAESTLLRV
ncbi:MAG TPA: acyl-CoA dehydrogenase, partial [Cytophagales bacterium]|nr:acyl-CoA dehydrogenase [Cytophagales bacterium]